jgi:hypothetical protein
MSFGFLISFGALLLSGVPAQPVPNESYFQSRFLIPAPPSAGGGLELAQPDHRFASGDRFRLQVFTREEGYVYAIVHGSGGELRVLYPFAEMAPGENRLRRDESRAIPDGNWYRFDNTPGAEDLYLIWSPRQIGSLDAAARDATGELELDTLAELQAMAPGDGSGLRVEHLRLAHVAAESHCRWNQLPGRPY